jgi:hypothetical protein
MYTDVYNSKKGWKMETLIVLACLAIAFAAAYALRAASEKAVETKKGTLTASLQIDPLPPEQTFGYFTLQEHTGDIESAGGTIKMPRQRNLWVH